MLKCLIFPFRFAYNSQVAAFTVSVLNSEGCIFIWSDIYEKTDVSTELAYVLGIVLVALGAAFCTKGDLGLSTVIAPAYVLYLKLSEIFPFVTFGMMEYVLQAVLLLGMIIVLRKFRLSYLFSFITAVIYGFTLDG